jgi:cytochrome c556
MFKKLAIVTGIVFSVAAIAGTTPAFADSKTIVKTQDIQIAMAKGFGEAIKKRRTIFRCIATGLKKIKEGKGDAKKNARLVLKNAAMLEQNLKALFPAGSHKGKTRAKKALWGDWDKFAKQAAALKAGATKLTAMDGSKKGLKGVYKTCKGCHKPFRGEKNKAHGKVKCS